MGLDSYTTQPPIGRYVLACAPPPLQDHASMKYADLARKVHSANPAAHFNLCAYPQHSEGRSTIVFKGNTGLASVAVSFLGRNVRCSS
jgi:hypothetical protein